MTAPRSGPVASVARVRPGTAATAWEALMRAQNRMLRSFESDGDFVPLSAREYDVLLQLSRAEGVRLPMRDLVERALVTQPSMSRLVDRLAVGGLVTREPDDGDRRAVVVALTPAGARLQRHVGRRHVRSITRAFRGLEESEARTLAELCARLDATTPTLQEESR